jgi:hypothetical protein
MTGRSFHPIVSVTAVRGVDVGVNVRVGTGVMGEYFLGFWVAVGNGADDLLSKSRAGSVCVEALTGIRRGRGVEVASPVQAVIKLQTIKTRSNRRFIRAKYSGGKLITDEILCYRVPHTYSYVTKLEVKILLTRPLKGLTY